MEPHLNARDDDLFPTTTSSLPIHFPDDHAKEDAATIIRIRAHHLFLILTTLIALPLLYSALFPDTLPLPTHLLFHHPSSTFILLNIIITFLLIFPAPESHHHHRRRHAQLIQHHHLPPPFTTATYNSNDNYAAAAAAGQESNTTLQIPDHQAPETTTALIEANEEKDEREAELMEKESEQQMAMLTHINPMDELSSEEFREMVENFIAAKKKSLLSERMADHRETNYCII